MKSISLTRKTTALCFGIFFICVFSTISGLSQQDNKQPDKKQDTQTDTKKTEPEKKVEAKDGWKISDYKPYISALKDLQALTTEYSEFLLKRGIDEYAKGLDTLDDMQTETARLKEVYKNTKYLNEKWFWQELDRKNAQDRHMNRIKVEAKLKAVKFFTKAINTIDEIRSDELKANPKYIDFKSKLFRIYVSTQYDLANMKPCIPILERYIMLNDENRKDVWAYKYMASCYAFMETILSRSGKVGDEDVVYFKNKKNQCMLTAIELQYGPNSAEYKELQKVVQLDEKKSEAMNTSK